MFNNTIEPAALMDDDKQQEREITNPLEHYFCNAVDLIQDTALHITDNPEPLKPLLLYCDGVAKRFSPFLFRGTLSIICGQKGCRKSTLTRALVQILVNGGLPGKTPYTITPAESRLKVAVIDTEQHAARVYRGFYKWLYENAPDKNDFSGRCQYYTARGKSTDDLINLLYTVCNVMNPDVIVLDVISHFIDDINDQKNSKIFIDIINELMRQFGVAVVGVMHQNPSTSASVQDKPAGAIGTKLLQAAEVVLNVARTPKDCTDFTVLGEIPGKKEKADKVKDKQLRNIGGNCSIVTFSEYRERYPERPRFAIVNDNKPNGESSQDLFLLPIEQYHRENTTKPEETRADIMFVPSVQVEQLYNKLANPEIPTA